MMGRTERGELTGTVTKKIGEMQIPLFKTF